MTQDPEYKAWVKNLCQRYRASQIKAAVKVNTEMLRYYWELGRDISLLNAENIYGSRFYATLSKDLKTNMPDASGLSASTIRYAKRFYELYCSYFTNLQQIAEKSTKSRHSAANEPTMNFQQLAEEFDIPLFQVSWGHHMVLIDKFSDNPQKAVFYVRQSFENGWSRAMLQNWIDSNLYERQGNAISNFKRTLPDLTSDLAVELTKDPYNFAFTGITGRYNERVLKDAMLRNITDFLVELGTGFAYVGKEYRLEIGNTENFIDLLFYNLKLSCYVVIEVKIGKFEFGDAGQLGGYVVACNHLLRKEGRDNPTIGLLICKEKDKIQAQYAIEASSQPIAISEYDLERFYPEKIDGTIPTIEELEKCLLDK